MASHGRTTVRVWHGNTKTDYPNSAYGIGTEGRDTILWIQTGSQSRRACFREWRHVEYVQPPSGF